MTVTLQDKYRFSADPIYVSGVQALVRLTMLESRRRAAQGKKTAVFVSGYRGSPLGGFDQALDAAREALAEHHVHFRPGVNEDLAATAVWGTQQAGVFGGARYDGVSALWYGKGPGVDRSGDAFKHGNLAGSAREGGVLAVIGDDPAAKSSSTAHQSEFALMAAMMPILAPASIAEIVEYGLIGWHMSRFSGTWTALKIVTDLADSTGTIRTDRSLDLLEPAVAPPPGGLNLRWPDTALAQEERLHRYKIPAVLAYAWANRLDRVVWDSRHARLGIVTVGKAYQDVRQALQDLGIDETRAGELGIRLYKVALAWPLEPRGVRAFAAGLEEILVIEEKRSLIEDQIKQQLYGAANAPRVIGKFDDTGVGLLPPIGEINPALAARAIAARLRWANDPRLREAVQRIESATAAGATVRKLIDRSPYFCSGCPHNTSTRVPEGSHAFAGIGCHYLAQGMERRTAGFTHMGGEGANWIGLAPFSTTEHVFQNMGDGTYFHSGSLAIRAAVASGANVTYKLLLNNAVAMTGGQPIDGELDVATITRQLIAEGVKRVVVVSDEPARYARAAFVRETTIHDRADLDRIQRDLRQIPGVTAIVYDQTCATVKRRLRKRGKLVDPQIAILINDLVCEGCGDCSKASNCLSVIPVETELGRKRSIDASSCNKDQSCLDGFCPSFVTLHGGRRRQPPIHEAARMNLPEPQLPALEEAFPIVVAGIGGTGVVTVGAILGMAAHLEGRAVRVLDMTGLAQKGGAVVSHIQIASSDDRLHSSRIGPGMARLLIGCDMVVAAAPENLCSLSRTRGRVLINEYAAITGQFTRDHDFAIPVAALRRQIDDALETSAEFLDATALATALVGDAVGTNLFMVGHAYQQGLIPLSAESICRAVELNGVAIQANLAAFTWGRCAAVDMERVSAEARRHKPQPAHHRLSNSVEEVIERRIAFLTQYQDRRYAERYASAVRSVLRCERVLRIDQTALTDAVARNLFRLMAYKDEYEVARLHTDASFLQGIAREFEGDFSLRFHLAPPVVARRDPATGHLRKRSFGPWMLVAFRLLARLRKLRGTPFDPFGRSRERRMERRLIREYFALIRELLQRLSPENYADAVALARVPELIRGFGHVKERSVVQASARQAALLDAWRGSQGVATDPDCPSKPAEALRRAPHRSDRDA